MRKVVQLFKDIMDKTIRKLPISKKARDPEVQEILEGDAYNMSSMALARKEGIQEGIQEGMQKGMQKGVLEGKKDVAKQLLIRGYEINEVVECTGISLEEVKTLQDNLQESNSILPE